MAKILIVDDSHLSRRLLSVILQQENHTVRESENGREALSMLDNEAFDLMITDISMPVMDGLELLDNVRANENIKGLPVIALTASIQDRLSKQAKDKGAICFITQPYSSWEIKRIVLDCLETSWVETCDHDEEDCNCVYPPQMLGDAIPS